MKHGYIIVLLVMISSVFKEFPYPSLWDFIRFSFNFQTGP